MKNLVIVLYAIESLSELRDISDGSLGDVRSLVTKMVERADIWVLAARAKPIAISSLNWVIAQPYERKLTSYLKKNSVICVPF